MRKFLLTAALALISLSAPAQDNVAEADKGYLTAILEESLSDTSQKVTITGFAGALSSQAKIESLTIADSQGIWITLNNVTLNWSRSALLHGIVDVTELSANEIILTRPPIIENTTSPEAKGFTLPELPVSIEIGRIAADRITLGETVLGEALTARLEASMSLSGGEGHAALILERTDSGPQGKLTLNTAYSNKTNQITLDLVAAEASGGIAVRKLGLLGTPATELSVKGSGTLESFAANLSLRSDGSDRLSGRFTISATENGEREFKTDIAGNLAPLFLPQYNTFFGPEISLTAKGKTLNNGSLDLEKFDLNAQAVHLSGTVQLDSKNLPLRINIQGQLGLPDGSPVLLPLSGENETRVRSANLSIGYNAAIGTEWHGRINIEELNSKRLRVDQLVLNGTGNIERPNGQSARFDANFRFAGQGITPNDPAFATALGTKVSGSANLHIEENGNGLLVRQLSLKGSHYTLNASGLVAGLSEGLRITGEGEANLRDLSRLSALTDRPLSGTSALRVKGNGSPLNNDFDIFATLDGQNISIGQTQTDHLLSGTSRIMMTITRDAKGTFLKTLSVKTKTLDARATGHLTSAGIDLNSNITFSNLTALNPTWGGNITSEISLQGVPATGHITVKATGNNLRFGQAKANSLLTGTSYLDLDLNQINGKFIINTATVTTPQIDANITGTATAAQRNLSINGRLANLGLFLPEFPGAVILKGNVLDKNTDYQVDMSVRGPGKINSTITGRVNSDFQSANLGIKGTLQAGIISPFLSNQVISGPVSFDLTLDGPLALSSLNGQASLKNGRIANIHRAFGFEEVYINTRITSGHANIDASTNLSTGGQIQTKGRVSLTAPFESNLNIALRNAILRDPRLYQTTASGTLTVTGPIATNGLLAGRILLNTTKIRIPSTGLSNANLTDLSHTKEPAAVRVTRDRADMLSVNKAKAKQSRPLRLDLHISAPSQVFIHGRGLDAELGGELTLGGTTDDIQPAGAFNLIRGRLDILDRRLVLSEATMLLEGNFVPTLTAAASTKSNGITSIVRIEGPATGLNVTFTSNSELPEEEVLSRLLFGRGLENLSPLQAAQLANAVATLAGRNGVGIIGRLRKNFGLDDFDVQTDAAGATSLTVGKYLTKNLYSELEVDQEGQSQINLNLDVSKNLTMRGIAGSAGQTGIGLFWEQDY
ncbi:MAG: translocation/assembly module TamB domain-containing protein [Rhodobacteraceae bacterium]|nr:translocation/assembly module TamB domain-containing protein [Paracoccaceae bacterium]